MELAIVKFLNRNYRFLDPVTSVISYIPYLVIFWTAVTLVILLSDGKAGQELALAFSMALAFHFVIIQPLMKHKLFFRARPYQAYSESIRPIGQHQSDSSFPSSHIASLAAIAVIYSHFYPSLWLLMTIIVIFMAFARLHNGMHYPSDILVGVALGLAYGVAAIYVTNYVINYLPV